DEVRDLGTPADADPKGFGRRGHPPHPPPPQPPPPQPPPLKPDPPELWVSPSAPANAASAVHRAAIPVTARAAVEATGSTSEGRARSAFSARSPAPVRGGAASRVSAANDAATRSTTRKPTGRWLWSPATRRAIPSTITGANHKTSRRIRVICSSVGIS